MNGLRAEPLRLSRRPSRLLRRAPPPHRETHRRRHRRLHGHHGRLLLPHLRLRGLSSASQRIRPPGVAPRSRHRGRAFLVVRSTRRAPRLAVSAVSRPSSARLLQERLRAPRRLTALRIRPPPVLARRPGCSRRPVAPATAAMRGQRATQRPARRSAARLCWIPIRARLSVTLRNPIRMMRVRLRVLAVRPAAAGLMISTKSSRMTPVPFRVPARGTINRPMATGKTPSRMISVAPAARGFC